MPLSRWIYEIVEEHLAEGSDEGAAQKSDLFVENRRLQRELEKSNARIKELETEIFKLKRCHGAYHRDTVSKTDRSAD